MRVFEERKTRLLNQHSVGFDQILIIRKPEITIYPRVRRTEVFCFCVRIVSILDLQFANADLQLPMVPPGRLFFVLGMIITMNCATVYGQ